MQLSKRHFSVSCTEFPITACEPIGKGTIRGWGEERMTLKVQSFKKWNRCMYKTAIFGCRIVTRRAEHPSLLPPAATLGHVSLQCPPPSFLDCCITAQILLLIHDSPAASYFLKLATAQRIQVTQRARKRGQAPEDTVGSSRRKEAPRKRGNVGSGAGWGLPTRQPRLSLQLSALSKLVLPPDQACPWALVRRQKGNSSSVAPSSGHWKPSLRTQVSRTVHNEVNLPVVNKENTV